jgi:hypothetical protein
MRKGEERLGKFNLKIVIMVSLYNDILVLMVSIYNDNHNDDNNATYDVI